MNSNASKMKPSGVHATKKPQIWHTVACACGGDHRLPFQLNHIVRNRHIGFKMRVANPNGKMNTNKAVMRT